MTTAVVGTRTGSFLWGNSTPEFASDGQRQPDLRPSGISRRPHPIHYEPFAHGSDRRNGKIAKLVSLQVRLAPLN